MLIKALRYVCPENIGKLDAFALSHKQMSLIVQQHDEFLKYDGL